jgi:hypothetical protein
MSRSKPLSRRNLLRGLLAGGAVATIPLPHLPSLRLSGEARAEDGVFPTRFGLFNWGNGMVPSAWIPDATGADWTPSHLLEPLARHQAKLSVLTGYEVKVPNILPHESGKFGFLTGIDPTKGNATGTPDTAQGPTCDQLVSAVLGGETRFRSLEVGLDPDRFVSWNGPYSPNPPETNAVTFFERVFGPAFREPGSDQPPDPKLALRQSVLDVVTGHIGDLSSKLGVEDKSRLDQHLTGIREIERRIAQLQLPPPDLEACFRPEAPLSMPSERMAQHAIMSELLAMSVACDQTRVFSYAFSMHNDDHIYEVASDGHHRLTHDEQGDQPTVQAITQVIMEQLAVFLDALDNIQEGDGTLLDHCALLCTSDVSLGQVHGLHEFPALVAGSANGALKPGMHVRTELSETAAKIPLTLLRAVGLRQASFGEDDAYTEDSIGEIEA